MPTFLQFALFVLSMLLPAMLMAESASSLKVDHVPICLSELGPAQDAFTAIGLRPDYGGPHASGGTQMALLGFDDGSYFELLAPQKPGSAESSPWGKLIAGNAGPCLWAVATDNLKAELERIQKAGIPTQGPFPGGRKRPDGQVLEWETASIGSEAQGAVLPFLIQDHTLHALRVSPSASLKGSELSGIAVVVIGVKDLNSAVALFRKAYGWPAPLMEDHKDFGARLAYFAGAPVVLATPLSADSWLTPRLDKFGDGPVASLMQTRNWKITKQKFPISGESQWFGRRMAWLDPKKVLGLRIGVME
jgi:hypothetical protein